MSPASNDGIWLAATQGVEVVALVGALLLLWAAARRLRDGVPTLGGFVHGVAEFGLGAAVALVLFLGIPGLTRTLVLGGCGALFIVYAGFHLLSRRGTPCECLVNGETTRPSSGAQNFVIGVLSIVAAIRPSPERDLGSLFLALAMAAGMASVLVTRAYQLVSKSPAPAGGAGHPSWSR